MYNNRNIPENVKETILNTLPMDKTEAVYIYGSYGTPRFSKSSDIDIAWYPKEKISIMLRSKYQMELRKKLDIEVDLKVVKDDYSVKMEYEILSGDCIYFTEDFREYFYEFQLYNKDMIDIIKRCYEHKSIYPQY
ncbi:nucleotidyltransferase domain-containing protein [Romboutsia sp.]|uniref:nucleotidyltransferase domain-containing protein n=1 Tax=Romboutsia sp. TaxID=1965302 RepID=UPI003F3E5B36